MNVKIDIDIAESILKAYARRSRDQIRVYGILLGSIEGGKTLHVQHCINGFIYESKESGEEGTTSEVQFKRLNDSILNSLLTTHKTNFPSQVILGGFSTDKELFMELFYLFGTINEIESKSFPNKNSILLLVDPSHKDEKTLSYGINTYNWKYDEVNKVMAYSSVNHALNDTQVAGASLHSYISNTDEVLLHLNNTNSNLTEEQNFKEVCELIKKSVDEELRLKANTSGSFTNNNLQHIKRQLLLTERFLSVFEKYVDGASTKEQNSFALSQMEVLLSEIEDYLNREDILAIVQKEFKENQIIDSLTNLLNVQVKLTEKINKFNL